jgi:hypothetical protein
VRDSAWFLAPVIVLIAGLSLARGETVETDAPWNPWWLRVVTQAPVTMPLSKTSVVPPSDPAAYPPSGVVPAPPPGPRRGAVVGCFAGDTGAPDNHHHVGQTRAVTAERGSGRAYPNGPTLRASTYHPP